MKKTLSIIIALVMLLGLAIPVSADADATFTFAPEESASCNAGDNVVIVIEVTSGVEYNSLMLRDFTYNTDVFEFVTFTYAKSTDTVTKQSMIKASGLDNDKVVISLPFAEEDYYNGRICTATFAVKSTAPTGTYTITATPVLKLDSDEYDAAVVPATISVTGTSSSAVVLEQDTDIEEVKDSYVDATSKAITVDNRTITGSNVFVTSEGQIRVDDGENAKIARDNGDGTTSQGFVFGYDNPTGKQTVVFEFEGTANDINYTGKTVTRQFDFTGSEIYGLANVGFAIVNIPKPLVVTVKAE
ncbi:MAG: hypothetical protein IJQ50_03020 [Clostridia bacterium]|nr:hypothetical protein [Clostridia bacterium]